MKENACVWMYRFICVFERDRECVYVCMCVYMCLSGRKIKKYDESAQVSSNLPIHQMCHDVVVVVVVVVVGVDNGKGV